MAKRRPSMILWDKKGNRYPVSFMTARERKAKLRRHTHELGYLTLAWNQLHDNLSAIFSALLRTRYADAGQVLWHALDNDFAQRKMLRAIVSLEAKNPNPELIPASWGKREPRPLPKKQCDEVLWILDQIDNKLRHKRNNAIHAPLILARVMTDSGPKLTIEAHLNPFNPRAKPLRGLDLIQEFRRYGDHAEMLARYAGQIRRALYAWTAPWPDRPAWPRAHKTTPKTRRVSGRPSQHPPGSS